MQLATRWHDGTGLLVAGFVALQPDQPKHYWNLPISRPAVPKRPLGQGCDLKPMPRTVSDASVQNDEHRRMTGTKKMQTLCWTAFFEGYFWSFLPARVEGARRRNTTSLRTKGFNSAGNSNWNSSDEIFMFASPRFGWAILGRKFILESKKKLLIIRVWFSFCYLYSFVWVWISVPKQSEIFRDQEVWRDEIFKI